MKITLSQTRIRKRKAIKPTFTSTLFDKIAIEIILITKSIKTITRRSIRVQAPFLVDVKVSLEQTRNLPDSSLRGSE